MGFRLEKCVSYITENSIKKISETFGKRLESKNVTRIQWIALYYLNTYSTISQKDLAECMYITDSSVARLLDRMNRDGLIERVKSEEDRRITYVKLTEKGQALINEILPEGEAFSNQLLEGLTEEELNIFEKVIHKMVENVVK
ncbi:MAG: MarR family transcriptional regulator, organic hydroperoxide resistance regulator [Clostridiales bacterium]|jgi:DNA-binding MarR family transcriptional regulator|nr:MarR family transcriptional regulator, organic hydroperoxide resistance regulator [Clostridiales bacterium]